MSAKEFPPSCLGNFGHPNKIQAHIFERCGDCTYSYKCRLLFKPNRLSVGAVM